MSAGVSVLEVSACALDGLLLGAARGDLHDAERVYPTFFDRREQQACNEAWHSSEVLRPWTSTMDGGATAGSVWQGTRVIGPAVTGAIRLTGG